MQLLTTPNPPPLLLVDKLLKQFTLLRETTDVNTRRAIAEVTVPMLKELRTFGWQHSYHPQLDLLHIFPLGWVEVTRPRRNEEEPTIVVTSMPSQQFLNHAIQHITLLNPFRKYKHPPDSNDHLAASLFRKLMEAN